MKYAILIESKNWRFAALERISQIINPSNLFFRVGFLRSHLYRVSLNIARMLSAEPYLRNGSSFNAIKKSNKPALFYAS